MSKQLTLPELDNLNEVDELVKSEIESLRQFIEDEPTKRREAEIERMQTRMRSLPYVVKKNSLIALVKES